MREKDKERKRKKREDEKKRKAKKKKKEKEKGKKGAVTNLWGKYGIIRETDMWYVNLLNSPFFFFLNHYLCAAKSYG